MAKDKPPERCVYMVWGWHSHQCSRKRGYGKDGRYCKQHAKIIELREKRSKIRKEE